MIVCLSYVCSLFIYVCGKNSLRQKDLEAKFPTAKILWRKGLRQKFLRQKIRLRLFAIHRIVGLNISITNMKHFTFNNVKKICESTAHSPKVFKSFCNSCCCDKDITLFAILVSSANLEILHFTSSSKSLIYIRKSMGPNTEP